MDNEFEIQKALGLSICVACEIVYTLNTWSLINKERRFTDIIFETYKGYGVSEHLKSLAKEWLKEQAPSATFIDVIVLYDVPRDKVGKSPKK